MTLVKVNEEIVEIIRRDKNNVTVLTSQREVKRISTNEIHTVTILDINRKLKEIRSNKFVYLLEYRKIKQYC